MQHLLTISQFDRADIEQLFGAADRFNDGPATQSATGRTVALAFFEESLRTRVGFELAAARLGAATTTVVAARESASMSAAETLEDTVRTLGGWCDAICLRHQDPTAPARAASVSDAAIVNCGNGADEHPTQALIDLFAINQLRGEIDGALIAIVGDLRHMRAAHSLLLGLSRFRGLTVRCVAPPGLEMPRALVESFAAHAPGSHVEETDEFVADDMDIVYMAGLPAHHANGAVDATTRARYAMTAERADRLRTGARVLCPMPRVDEIDTAVDGTDHDAYFTQARISLGVRAAVLERLLVVQQVVAKRFSDA